MEQESFPEGSDIATSLRWFASNSYGDSSPIYRAVIEAVADDHELHSIIEAAPADARHPGVLLAAVKFLLADYGDHPLARHYAELRVDGVVDAFRSFVLGNRSAVLDIMRVRRIQTNEVARTAVLAPAVREVQRRVNRPLALIDVGTSAGLNLMLDGVRIDYGHSTLGPADSPLPLVCHTLDEGPPPGPELDIRWRVGLDHAPVDLADDEERRWLEACIWPEHVERSERLATAAQLQQHNPPRLVRGDAVEGLAPLIEEVPNDLMVVVMTSWTAVYLAGAQRRDMERAMASAGRSVAWVSAEFPGVVRGIEPARPARTDESDLSQVAIVWFPPDGQEPDREFVAWSDNHGGWLDWPLATTADPP